MTTDKRKRTAIDAKRGTVFLTDPDTLTVVGLDDDAGPSHPLYDERVKEPLSEETIQDFCIRGVLEPVLVRKNGDIIEVAAGRRRVLHAREANKRLEAAGKELIRVPALLKTGTDADMMGISIAENAHRKGDGIRICAQKLSRYLATGRTEAEAAIAFNVTQQTIKNWLAFNDLDVKAQRAIDAGTIPASAARDLARLTRDDQREALDALIASAAGGRVTAKNVTATTKAKKTGTEANPAPGKRLVMKVLKANEDKEVLDESFVNGVLWVLGELNERTVKGLTGLVKEARGE